MRNKSKDILLISSQVFKTPPSGYGGIERICALAYETYRRHAFKVDIVSRKDSVYHTYTYDDITKELLDSYRVIITYDYRKELLELLNTCKSAYAILQNTYKPKLEFLAHLHNLQLYALSTDSRNQYVAELRRDISIIPNGVDLKRFKNLEHTRKDAILFIGGFGMHKSPLTCLRYARDRKMRIAFYGLPIYREEEKAYEKLFYKELAAYKSAELHGEVNDIEKIELLNRFNYFIFLPGIDKETWIEPFGIAPLEAMACGCTVITQFDSGGHKDFCIKGLNSVSYKDPLSILDTQKIRKSILEYDFDNIWAKYYPK